MGGKICILNDVLRFTEEDSISETAERQSKPIKNKCYE